MSDKEIKLYLINSLLNQESKCYFACISAIKLKDNLYNLRKDVENE